MVPSADEPAGKSRRSHALTLGAISCRRWRGGLAAIPCTSGWSVKLELEHAVMSLIAGLIGGVGRVVGKSAALTMCHGARRCGSRPRRSRTRSASRRPSADWTAGLRRFGPPAPSGRHGMILPGGLVPLPSRATEIADPIVGRPAHWGRDRAKCTNTRSDCRARTGSRRQMLRSDVWLGTKSTDLSPRGMGLHRRLSKSASAAEAENRRCNSRRRHSRNLPWQWVDWRDPNRVDAEAVG